METSCYFIKTTEILLWAINLLLQIQLAKQRATPIAKIYAYQCIANKSATSLNYWSFTVASARVIVCVVTVQAHRGTDLRTAFACSFGNSEFATIS